AINEPFSHVYLEDVFPADIYEQLLALLPSPQRYNSAAERHYGNGDGSFVRWMFPLTPDKIAGLSTEQKELWRGVASALTAPALKCAVFAKLARDLSFRYAVSEADVPHLAGYSRPTLYRETEGFEIPPHPDTRKKVVTMHLYLPADRSQLGLGTALYRRRLLAWPVRGWRPRFVEVKQFAFRPHTRDAFVINNHLTHNNSHRRDKLPP